MNRLRQKVPDVLLSASEYLTQGSRTGGVEDWIFHKDALWSLRFKAWLSVQETAFMPQITCWHLLVWPSGSGYIARIHPDKTEGITATFPHQNINEEISSSDWRTGNPCLEKSLNVFGRRSWSDEPGELEPRLKWLISRLLIWIDSAACNQLIREGDPLELPVYAKNNTRLVVGFNESQNDFLPWITQTEKWGFASTARLPGSYRTRFISHFFRSNGETLKRPEWCAQLRKPQSVNNALWIILPELPVLSPWQAPATWEQLTTLMLAQGVCLKNILVTAGQKIRREKKGKSPTLLLLGFPLAEKVGAPASRMHWLALNLPALCLSSTRRKGYRANERHHRLWDAEITQSGDKLYWLSTSNWSSDQVRTRGGVANDFHNKKVLLIGAGALGSAISENLVRMGITQLGIMDEDTMAMGNLSRHILDMASVGHNKAEALAAHLNGLMPDAAVKAYKVAFPPLNPHTIALIKNYDVIVDCTGDDDVLEALASFDWALEKIFVSLAITWKAEGMFAYAASESRFPVVDALSHFSKSAAPEATDLDMYTEGIGCWHAVFPATAGDVRLWGAMGTRFILQTMENPGRHYKYFRQLPDGTIECPR